MKAKLGDIFSLLKETVGEWSADRAPQLAASLAYYTVFSIAPLLLIAIAIAGAVFGREAAQNEVMTQLQGLMGQDGASVVQTMLESAAEPKSGTVATIVSVISLLFGAAGAFSQIKAMMNVIWNAPAQPPANGIVATIFRAIRQQLFSFTMVLGTGFLLLASLILSAVLAAAGRYFETQIPILPGIWQLINFLVSFVVITLLFAAIYKLLPDVHVAWSDVWLGAAVASLLFTIGKQLIGLYLGQSGVASAYGAAGSLVVLLLWVYYSAQILFFGAEMTQVYARKFGTLRAGGVPEPKYTPPTNTSVPHQDAVPTPRADAPRPVTEGRSVVALMRERQTVQPEPSAPRPLAPSQVVRGSVRVLRPVIALITMIAVAWTRLRRLNT